MFSNNVKRRLEDYFSSRYKIEVEVMFKNEINSRYYVVEENKLKPLIAFLYDNKDVIYLNLNFGYGALIIYELQQFMNYDEVLKDIRRDIYDIDTTTMEYKQNLMEYKLGNHDYLYTPF